VVADLQRQLPDDGLQLSGSPELRVLLIHPLGRVGGDFPGQKPTVENLVAFPLLSIQPFGLFGQGLCG